eukprot:COSAG06_NODE_3032_length_5939_cov_4.174114_5_plen_403_part_00
MEATLLLLSLLVVLAAGRQALTTSADLEAAQICETGAPSVSVQSSPTEIESWVNASTTFAEFAPLLRQHKIDGLTLATVSRQELTAAVHLPLGIAFNLKRCFDYALIQTGIRGSPPPSSPPPPPPPPSTAAATRTRKLQTDTCSVADIDATMVRVNQQCCEPGHRRLQAQAFSENRCSDVPNVCTTQCAAAFIPFYDRCSTYFASVLGGDPLATSLDALYSKCQQAHEIPPPLSMSELVGQMRRLQAASGREPLFTAQAAPVHYKLLCENDTPSGNAGMQYGHAEDNGHASLSDLVEQEIGRGWFPLGGIAVGRMGQGSSGATSGSGDMVELCQAMVTYPTPPPPPTCQDDATWSDGTNTCADYAHDTVTGPAGWCPNCQCSFADASGASASDACQLTCGSC